jgi:hypothetical protein
MRHQSLQTAAERKGGGDHDDSQGGAEQGWSGQLDKLERLLAD